MKRLSFAFLLLGLTGCAQSANTVDPSAPLGYLTGTVVEEMTYATGSHQLGYTLQVQTGDGFYTFDVFHTFSRSTSVLSLLIDKGTTIRFPVGGFGRNRTGYLYVSDIEILQKKEE